MGERIEEGYRERFRSLLALVRPRRLEFGVDLLMRRAHARSEREGLPAVRALADLYEFTRVRVERRLALTGACSIASPAPGFAGQGDPRFVCDASLGGLARWLRAAGYEAAWVRDVRGDDLLRVALGPGGVLLTSDSRLLSRRAIRDGSISVLWVPSALTRLEQLRIVMRDLGLKPRQPRCMACGGVLQPVDKADVRDRIPPRTALWKDEYFLCSGCGKLLWQGTHWERIARCLATLGSA